MVVTGAGGGPASSKDAQVSAFASDFYGYIFAKCWNHHSAEDLVQESLYLFIRERGCLPHALTPGDKGRLYQIADNQVRKYRRRKKREVQIRPESVSTLVDPGGTDDEIDAELVQRIVSELSPDEQLLSKMVMRGIPSKVIARQLGIDLNALGLRRYRLRARITRLYMMRLE